jgi:hypothetical protein
MSKLLPETCGALRSHRAHKPRFSSMITAALFDEKNNRGRFRILPTFEGRFVVYDPIAEFGMRSRGDCGTLEEAVARADQCSAEATARGESNEPERHGWKLNWDKPETWEPHR